MRWLVGAVFLFCLFILGGYIFIKGYPYRLYSNWMNGEKWNRYYDISNYRQSFLSPIELDEIPPYKEDYAQLWREFPIRNAVIPLPVRHPLFQTVPVLEFTGKKNYPRTGMLILNAANRELSKIYTLPTSLAQDHLQGQELFKLPFVRNRLLRLNPDQVWKDLFTHKIEVKSKALDEMIYDLYLLHVRSKFLPKETLRFGLIKEGKVALIELKSQDKNYIVELVLTYDNGRIYSYALRTHKTDPESQKLRAKFLNSINFMPIDSSMGKILYTEFKQLNFARQVDQEGLLYLYSAWSQDLDRLEMLREMIFYLERGNPAMNEKQLKVLYKYALNKYGKTFTTRKNFHNADDADLTLQRKIEIEDRERRQAAEREKGKVGDGDLTPDEKMNIYLKKAKESGPSESKDMTIH